MFHAPCKYWMFGFQAAEYIRLIHLGQISFPQTIVLTSRGSRTSSGGSRTSSRNCYSPTCWHAGKFAVTWAKRKQENTEVLGVTTTIALLTKDNPLRNQEVRQLDLFWGSSEETASAPFQTTVSYPSPYCLSLLTVRNSMKNFWLVTQHWLGDWNWPQVTGS